MRIEVPVTVEPEGGSAWRIDQYGLLYYWSSVFGW